jgi:ABC-type molybdate transport system permease subunit
VSHAQDARATLKLHHESGKKMIWEPLKLSLLVVTVATVIIATLGLALGLLLAKGRFHGQELLASFFTLPLVLPPTVSGYYLSRIARKARSDWRAGV